MKFVFFIHIGANDDFFGVFLPCGLRLDRLSNKLSQPLSYNIRSKQAKNNCKSKNATRTLKNVWENICLYCYSMLYKL